MIPRWISFALVCLPAVAQQTGADFFESKIRPVLADKCYGCHSTRLAIPVAGLAFDTKDGLARVVTAGKPDQSRIYQVISYNDPHVKLPPSGKLPHSAIAAGPSTHLEYDF
jgi:hypothetical protein